MYFSQLWGPEVQDQGTSRIGFILSPLLLACMWPSSHPVLTRPLCAHKEKNLCPPLLIRPSILLDSGPNHMTSFNLYYLHKGPISKYSHIEIGASTYKWGGGRGQNSVPNQLQKENVQVPCKGWCCWSRTSPAERATRRLKETDVCLEKQQLPWESQNWSKAAEEDPRGFPREDRSQGKSSPTLVPNVDR